VPDYVDSVVLAATLLAGKRIKVFTDGANLPLRAPTLLAKTAASLDLMSNRRFELGQGAAGYWQAIMTMGVSARSAAEANAPVGDAIPILRSVWQGDGSVIHMSGKHYHVNRSRSGPAPAQPIGIWTGAQGRPGRRCYGVSSAMTAR
jgi:alkanesulfonate monooxygenase SsuD/methylene tetrahydromethanopterin reductase-like flavin-dependent oxidoreductase (luciferase family)